MYLEPTRKGTGVTVWGTYDDLTNLYDAIKHLNLWEYTHDNRGSIERIIDVFSYELRHAYQGNRKTKQITYRDGQSIKVYGFHCTWVELLFTTSCIRRKCSYSEVSKFQHGTFLLLESEIERALYEYDPQGAVFIEHFINHTDVSSDKLWHHFNEILLYFLHQPAGKKRFRDLPVMLRSGSQFSPMNSYIENSIKNTQDALRCELWEIEYLQPDNIVW